MSNSAWAMPWKRAILSHRDAASPISRRKPRRWIVSLRPWDRRWSRGCSKPSSVTAKWPSCTCESTIFRKCFWPRTSPSLPGWNAARSPPRKSASSISRCPPARPEPMESYALWRSGRGCQAEAPAPQRCNPLRTKVGQTLSSVNPQVRAIFSLLSLRIEVLIHVHPDHSRPPRDRRYGRQVTDEGRQDHQVIPPAGPPPEQQHQQEYRRNRKQVAEVHRAHEVAGLALKLEPAHRAVRMHGQATAPQRPAKNRPLRSEERRVRK